ncbi:MAG: LPS export ABC transporter permease LptG [Calditrichia bacterium]
MRLIDRYISRKFFSILFYTILAFIIIFVVIDLIENLDKFLSHDASFGSVFRYYVYYIPFIIILTLPVCMLLSSLFSLGSMAQYNELIAIQTSGISMFRIITPVVALALIVSIVSGIAGETVVPYFNRLRLDIYRYEIKKEDRKIKSSRNYLAIQDGNNRQIFMQFYETHSKKGHKVSVLWTEKSTIVRRMDARFMVWDEKNQSWVLQQVIERVMSDSGETIYRHEAVAYDQTRITPEDLADVEITPEEMNYQELNRFVDKMLRLGADARKWLVDLYMKISYPFANFIIVLFGAPLAAKKRRSGPALGFALALLISFIYFLFLRTGQVLGHKGTLEPLFAAWIGNLVFGFGAILMMFRIRQ